MVAGAFTSTDHPLLAHIIPIRRCNLACEYCNEYDDFSKPVPTRRHVSAGRQAGGAGDIGHYHQRRRAATHPELDQIIAPHSQARHDCRA